MSSTTAINPRLELWKKTSVSECRVILGYVDEQFWLEENPPRGYPRLQRSKAGQDSGKS